MKKKLQEKIEDARKEMAKYATSQEFAALSNVKKWILVFCKDELVFVEAVE